MPVEIDLSGANIPGLPNKMEVKNAAEEATLKELVELFRKNNNLLQKIAGQTKESAGKSGGNAGGGAPGGSAANPALQQAQKQQVQGAQAAAKSSQAQATVGQKLGQAMGKVAQGAGKVVGGMFGLAGAVVQGAQKIEDFALHLSEVSNQFMNLGDDITRAADTLKRIPLVGNLLAGSLGVAAEAADRAYNEYTKLSEIGASFGGSMNDMINAATGAGLTMQQFNSIVKDNGPAMMALGGTTEQGAKRFAQLGKQMRQSEVGDRLLRLGFTTEQVNSGMASYINIVRSTGQLQGMSTKQLAESSGRYLTDLNELARITGQSVDEKKKEAEALAKDVQFRASMQKLSAEEQAQMINMINAYPEAHRTAIKDMIATGSITTEEGRKFQQLYPEAAANFRSYNSVIKSGRAISKAEQEAQRNRYIDESKSTLQRNQQLLTFSRDFDQIGAGIIEAQAMQKDAYAKAAAESRKISSQSGATAEQIAKFKQKIAQTSNEMTKSMISPDALKALESAFSGLSKIVTGIVGPVMGALFKVIGIVVDTFGSVLGPVIDAAVAAFQPFIEGFHFIIDLFKAFLAPAIVLVSGILNSTLVPAVKIVAKVLSIMIDVVKTILTPVFKVLGYITQALVDGFSWVSDGIETVLDTIDRFGIGIMEVVDKLLGYLPEFMGGLSDEEAKQRAARRDDQRKDLEERKKARESLAEERKTRDQNNKEMKGESQVDFSSPVAMLKSYGEATGSIYAKQAAEEEKRLEKEKEQKKSNAQEVQKAEKKVADEKIEYTVNGRKATKEEYEAQRKGMEDIRSQMGKGQILTNESKPAESSKGNIEKPGFWNSIFGKTLPKAMEKTKEVAAEEGSPDVISSTTSALQDLRDKGIRPFTTELVKFKNELSGEELLEGFEDASSTIGNMFSNAFVAKGFAGGGGGGGGAARAAGGAGGGGGGGGAARAAGGAGGGGGGGGGSMGGAEAGGKLPSVGDKQGRPFAEDSMAAGDLAQFVKTPSGADLDGLEGGTKQRLAALAQEYFNATGEKIQVNTAFRSYEEQMELFKKYGSPRAARPGRSKHEVGLAFDMQSAHAAKAIQMGLFDKYGFHRPVAGETWHIEPVEARGGVPDNPVAPGQEVMVANAGKPVTPDSGKLKAEKGGIFSGPASGYDVEMHNAEAVVPLPDGRSIPVSGMGGGDQKAMIDLLTQLNNKMDELVFINSQMADTGNRQLRVQKNMGHPDLLIG